MPEGNNKHKYSTFLLLGLIGLVTLTVLVSGIEGVGTKNYLTKFLGNDLIGNSSISDDGENVTISGSPVCTVANGLCSTVITLNITGNVTGNITPATDDTYSIGSKTKRWQRGYFSDYLTINAGTTEPTIPLEVQGNQNINLIGAVINTVPTIGVFIQTGSIKMSRATTSPVPLNISTDVTSGSFGSGGGDIIFSPNVTEKVRIQTNGLVGIGTNSPISVLDVDYPVNIASSSTGITVRTPANYYNGITLINENISQVSAPSIKWSSNGTTLSIRKDTALRALDFLNGSGLYSARIGTSNTNSYFQLDGGNIGIGTTIPSQKLDVNGSINISATSGKTYFNSINLNSAYMGFNPTSIFELTSVNRNFIISAPRTEFASTNVNFSGNVQIKYSLNITGNLSVMATDNASQMMCLNVSQTGTVSAYRC